MRSVVVVLPASTWAMMPMFRSFSIMLPFAGPVAFWAAARDAPVKENNTPLSDPSCGFGRVSVMSKMDKPRRPRVQAVARRRQEPLIGDEQSESMMRVPTTAMQRAHSAARYLGFIFIL